MNRILKKPSGYEGVAILSFMCPGCQTTHEVRVADGPGAKQPFWEWNGSLEYPTFAPSVLATSGHFIENRGTKECWCTYNAKHPDAPAPFKCYRCHSYVRDGRIEFLSDCSHALAGQTVYLPEYEQTPQS